MFDDEYDGEYDELLEDFDGEDFDAFDDMEDDAFDFDDDEDFEDYESFADDDFDADDFDYDGDFEGDEFFGRLKKLAKRIGRGVKKVAKKLAPLAKRHAGKIGTLIGGAIGGPAGAAIGGKVGGFVKNLEDDEGDTEDEMYASIAVPAVDDGMAEAMAAAASRSKPSDAQALGGAITITIMSRAPLAVKSVAPGIASASGRIAKSMAAHPASRPLVKTVPTIVKRTTATLARKARKGKPVTKATTARVMTKHAKRVLGSSSQLAKALASNAAKRKRLNRAAIARAERFY